MAIKSILIDTNAYTAFKRHDLILFTYDSDFQHIENLKLGNCLADFI